MEIVYTFRYQPEPKKIAAATTTCAAAAFLERDMIL